MPKFSGSLLLNIWPASVPDRNIVLADPKTEAPPKVQSPSVARATERQDLSGPMKIVLLLHRHSIQARQSVSGVTTSNLAANPDTRHHLVRLINPFRKRFPVCCH